MFAVVLSVGICLLWLYDWYIGGSDWRAAKARCDEAGIVYGYDTPKDPTLKYVRPTDRDYSPPFSGAEYFCNEQEAIDAGYIPLYDEDGMYNQG